MDGFLDGVQLALDVVGLIPGLGERIRGPIYKRKSNN